jgi:tetratricopeptide (TPR) repeat protein
LSDRGHTQGSSHLFGEAKQLFLQAAELDTTLVAALVRAGWAAMSDGSPAEAESLAHVADSRRDRLTVVAAAQLDQLLAETSGDKAAALRAARRMPEIPLDLAIRAIWTNRPSEAVAVLTDNEWYPGALRVAGLYGVEQYYWLFLAMGYHMLGEHEAELGVAVRAREQYPQSLFMLQVETRALAALGRIDELDGRLEEAIDFPDQEGWLPTSVMVFTAFELRAHGHLEASLGVAEKAIAWYETHPPDDPRDRERRSAMALAFYAAERWDDARALYEDLAIEFPDSVNYQGFLGTLAARRGDRDEALSISEGLVGLNDPYDFGRDTYWQACIAALLGEGEHERAMELLRGSFADGRKFNLQLHLDLDLEALFDDPAFQAFLEPKG